MAIYHCSMKPVARSGGRSAVAAVAYRTATAMLNERDGVVHDFTRKQGVVHAEIVLPDGVEAEWACDRSRLWNSAEKAEKRKDARVAREFEIALPHELSPADRLALTRSFARDLADRFGAAVDFAIHQPQGTGDLRNIHAHVMMTTRMVTPEGLGEKTLIERENRWLLNHDHPTAQMQLRDIRQAFELHANRCLMRAGLDIRIDHRSHQERGLEIEPTEHMGVHAAQMEGRGIDVSRARLDEEAARRNAALIREKPEQVLTILTGEKSVFDRHDVARTLHRYIDDSQGFRNAFAAVMASPALVELQAEQTGKLARYSTREMLQVEHAMAESAGLLARSSSHGVDEHHVEQALRLQDDAIRSRAAVALAGKVDRGELVSADRGQAIERSGLSEEQRVAVKHVTGPQRVAAVIGFAGAGKSTMLAAARDAWERQGYRVHGAALAGKAAEGLEVSSGIASRTLASWDHSWTAGRGVLGTGDVLVIDEAGMVGSRQLARFVVEAEARGAKLVLVGDYEQLQAIGAGSPFRAIAERIGAVELSEIRRQTEGWQRGASIAFATHRTREGLATYADRGAVRFCETRDEARADLVEAYLRDLEENPQASRIALAHRRIDVRAINAQIRASLQRRRGLAQGEQEQGEVGRELVYQTHDGKRSFAPGDRIVLLENNRDLGVKNGMLGRVMAVGTDALQIRLDGGGHNEARHVSIPVKSYQSFDHGYATTIHKSQGATVDRAFVMASATMDRHLTYVAMTRHRDSVQLYAGRDELKDMEALAARMSRSGAKETTLDYLATFAERRGLSEERSDHSRISIPLDPGRADKRMASFSGSMREDGGRSAAVQPSKAAEARQNGQGVEASVEEVQVLIPAVREYARTVEDIAREKARPSLEREMKAVHSVGRKVYSDPDGVAVSLSMAILDQGIDGQVLAKSVRERPEQFGVLRGKSGLLGENRERKAARHYARALGNHVASAAQTWARRLEEERRKERWTREKRDVIEVPGLTTRSHAILKQLDGLPQTEKAQFLHKLTGTAEGQHALEEAKRLVAALEQRFGDADLRHVTDQTKRLEPGTVAALDRIKEFARIAYRAQSAELSRQYELKRSLNMGLRM